MNEYHYRPLPNQVIIKTSLIEGLGLFSTQKIAKNTNLGIGWLSLPNDEKLLKDLFQSDEAVEWLKKNDMWIRTPLGGFLNHSDSPNCIDEYVGGIVNLVTIRDIEEGEELTMDYRKSQGISLKLDENGTPVFEE